MNNCMFIVISFHYIAISSNSTSVIFICVASTRRDFLHEQLMIFPRYTYLHEWNRNSLFCI
jgi:hypothetical protein